MIPVKKLISRSIGLVLVFCLLSAAAIAAEIPEKTQLMSEVSVNSNSRAAVDYSNTAEGQVSVKYTGGKDVRIKVQITRSGGTTYTYDLNNAGKYETFPLVEGDGLYNIRIFENTGGTRYAQVYSTDVTMELRNEFLPFLYPNQYVNFTEDGLTALTAGELTKDIAEDFKKVGAVYDHVVKNIHYDYDKMATVQSTYLPDPDLILAEGKGICFDYAALMTAMLRSQGIPCKLVIGYAGSAYHAWVNVYIQGQGWISQAIYFDGNDWKLMDPTFASTSNNSYGVIQSINEGSMYRQVYAY